MQNIVIFGSGGHAKVVIDIIEKQGQYKILGLLDSNKLAGSVSYGYEILGDDNYIAKHEQFNYGIVAIGDNWVRSRVVEKIIKVNPLFNFIKAIHPNSSIAKGVVINEGTVIMAGSVVNSDSIIGEHCIVNTKTSVDHDNTIGNFVNLSPNTTTGGNVLIEDFCILSLGSSIIHSVRIGEHSLIGAGSTVLNNIDPYSVVYGTPAKFIRNRIAGDQYL